MQCRALKTWEKCAGVEIWVEKVKREKTKLERQFGLEKKKMQNQIDLEHERGGLHAIVQKQFDFERKQLQ